MAVVFKSIKYMNIASEILFVISNGLLIPVLLLLLFLFAKAIWSAIIFYPEYRRRKAISSALKKLVQDYSFGKFEETETKLREISPNPVAVYLDRMIEHREDKDYCEHELQNFNIEIQKILSKYRVFIKFGPMLGLMGTLIPMGPALVGLSIGDIASMAYNMQVAFATTVVGMAIAAFGLLAIQSAKSFYARVFNDLEFITHKLTER